MRKLQPAVAFSTFQDSNSTGAAWAAAALVFGGVALSAEEKSFCEQRKSNVLDPKTFPTEDNQESSIQATSAGLKDPLTVYAKYAAQRELEDEAESAPEQATQATSPVLDKEAKEMIAKKYMNEMTADELKIEEATRKAKQHSGGLKIFSGNGNMALSLEIARHLGINLGKATVGRFADGEANVVIHENVRGKDIYVIQPTCTPVNDNIMELLLMISTLRRASARRITVVIPYYGYARQDRKMQVSSKSGSDTTIWLSEAQFAALSLAGPCPHFCCRCCTPHGGYGS
jgi:hypothetical protein